MKLFNNDLVNLRKDVIVADIESKSVDPIDGYACRTCNRELFQLTGTIIWQCPGCNAQYEDKRYAKAKDGEISTTDGTSEIEAGSANIISVDSYEMFRQGNPSAKDLKRAYHRRIFTNPRGAKVIERDT